MALYVIVLQVLAWDWERSSYTDKDLWMIMMGMNCCSVTFRWQTEGAVHGWRGLRTITGVGLGYRNGMYR